MATEELSRTESYQYPSAHVGHLSNVQQSRLDAFKKLLCEEGGYYTPVNADTGKPASHDDETLLRYLRARRFSPREALRQFVDTEKWRRQNNLEQLYETIDIREYDETRKLYPQWTGRRDRRGIPVYVFEVAQLNSKNMAAYEQSITAKQPSPSSKVPNKMLRLFALYESLTRFVLPLCTAVSDRPHPETPVSQSSNIVDISGVGLKQFWNLKGHMQDASTLATAHYPETLDRIFVIGAPTFFPTVWSWIKRWFDPITVSKIFILSTADMKSTLEKYIDPANIPTKYGGQLDYEFGMMPNLEPAIQAALNWESPVEQRTGKTFPTGPLRLDLTDGGLTAVAVGSEKGKQRHSVVARIKTESKINAEMSSAAEEPKSEAQTQTNTGSPPQPLVSNGGQFDSEKHGPLVEVRNLKLEDTPSEDSQKSPPTAAGIDTRGAEQPGSNTSTQKDSPAPLPVLPLYLHSVT